MADNNQEVRGIVGDILNLISLQTGLQYETVVVNSREDMLSEMKKGNWHIVQAAAYDLSLQNALSFTHPFITTQFVTVVRKEDAQAIALKAGARGDKRGSHATDANESPSSGYPLARSRKLQRGIKSCCNGESGRGDL
jgi:hypothetical protein